MNIDSATNDLQQAGSGGRPRPSVGLRPTPFAIAFVGGIGIVAVLLAAVNSQLAVAIAAFAAMVTCVMLIKVNPRIVFFGLILGYFFGGNIFGKLGLASVGIPLYMGEVGIGAGVLLLVATNILEHREWRVALGSMRPLLVPLVLFLVAGAVSVVIGGSGVVPSEVAAVPIAVPGEDPWFGEINSLFYSLKVAARHFAFVYYGLMFFVPAIIIRSAAELRNSIYVVVGALLLVIPVRQLGLIEHLAHYYHPVGMIACLALLYRERSLLGRLGLAVLILWAAYLTLIDDVRSSFLALGVVAFLAGLHALYYRRRSLSRYFTRSNILAFTAATIFVGVIGWWFVPASSFRELRSIFNQADQLRILMSGDMADFRGGNEGWRTAMWSDMLQAAFRAPLTGIGLGTPFYPASFMQKGWFWKDFNDQSLTMFVYPHNSVLFVLLRMGLPATVALLVVLVRCWRMAFSMHRVARWRFASDAAYFLGAATLFMFVASLTSVMLELPQAAIPFWFLLGLIPVCARYADAEHSPSVAARVEPGRSAVAG
jgi:O-antigen ligase